MKIFFTLFFSMILLTVRAQDSLVVSESEKSFNKGNFKSYSIKIPLAKFRDVKSDWKKHLHQKGNISVKESDGEIYIPRTIISEITSDTITIYSTVVANQSDVEITGIVGKNDSVFHNQNTNPDIVSGFKSFLRNFAVIEFRNAVMAELSLEQKKLKILEQNLTDLENDNDRYGKKIKVNERSIERSEEEIKTNKDLQEIKSTTILQQQKIVATYLTKSDQKAEEEKKLKAILKEKKKLEKEHESLHEDVEDKERDNKTLKKQIDQNESENIPNKKAEIEKQKLHLTEIENKIRRIQ